MILTNDGKEFLENLKIYKAYGLNNIVTISGIEILKDNKILPACTLYVEAEDGNIIFVADYCSETDVKKLKEQISKEIEIKSDKNLSIEETQDKANNQEVIKRLAYADPDIRPVLFSGETIVNDNKITIENNKILLDGEESSAQNFILKLFSEKDSPEKRIFISKEIEKKKNILSQILENLVTMDSLINKEGVTPKIVNVEGENYPAILFRENGKYKAFLLGTENKKIINKFEIKENLTWEQTFELIKNSYSISKTKEIEDIKENLDIKESKAGNSLEV